MATNTEIASIEEQQNILRQKASEARKKALSAATEEERNKYMDERDAYNKQIKELTAQKAAVSEQNPATSSYEGVDQNSGRQKYYNPATGEMYLSDTPPTDAQRTKFQDAAKLNGIPVTEDTSTATPPAVATSNVPVAIQETTTIQPGSRDAVNVIVEPPANPEPVAVTTSDPAAQTNLLTPEQSIAAAQKTDDTYGENAAAALRRGQTGDAINTSNTPVSQAVPEGDVGQTPDTNTSILNTIQANPPSGSGGTASSVDSVRTEATNQAQNNQNQETDWRVRIQLAKNANYLYQDPDIKESDILYPLQGRGVIFPYTPTIQVSHRANYDAIDLVHNNYKQYFYKNSSVEDIVINADFTAQDTGEANYLLAVIHFFRSVTKMFYGQDGSNDAGPRAGTPPPLCYLYGLGQFQYNNQALLINNFSYTLPNDVDYIRAGSTTTFAGTNLSSISPKDESATGNNDSGWRSFFPALSRLAGSQLTKGGINPQPTFQALSNSQATYVPTKIQLTISAYPIVTRKMTTDTFSLKQYATGELLKKGFW